RQIILRQIGPIDRRRLVIADHADGAAKTLAPQHLRRGEAGRAAADNHDLARTRAGRPGSHTACFGWRLLRLAGKRALAPHHDRLAIALDLPNRKRAQRRRTRRRAAAQREAGMMPGPTDAIADHKAFREGTMIMAAEGIDRENLGPELDQQHLVLTDMAEQLSIAEIGRRYALGEIRSAWLVVLAHGCFSAGQRGFQPSREP